jgi:sugar transferase (PEP-CTERM system associated)
MIRVFSHYVSGKLVLLVGLDALLLLFSAYIGISLHAAMTGSAPAVSPAAIAFLFGMLIVLSSTGLYQVDLLGEAKSIQRRLLASVPIGFALTFLIWYLAPSLHLGLDVLALMVVVAMGGSALARVAVHRWGELSGLKPRVLVLGTGSRVLKLAEAAQHSPHHVVVGYVALQPARHYVPLSSVLPMSAGESLSSMVDKYGIDEIVVAVRDRRGGALPVQDLLRCRLKGVRVTELQSFYEREYRQVMLETVNPSWMVFGQGFRLGWGRALAKRLFDLLASALLLVLTLPVLAVAALAILVESGLPLVYRQERVGRGGRVFTVYKLRSMRHDAEQDGTPQWAAADDERTTPVGRILRKLRIDELPQILNVLKGEMSLVGPRPERPFFTDKLVDQLPYYSLRHSVKPGITGWAQVRYHYGSTLDDTVEKLQYDLYYVKNQGLFLDLSVLIATVKVVLTGTGAR